MKTLESRIATLIAKCWTDTEFKERFVRDPKTVIAEAVLDSPGDVEIVVVQDTPHKRHVVLPAPPSRGFSTQDLDDAAFRFLELGMALYCRAECREPEPHRRADPYCRPETEFTEAYPETEYPADEAALYCKRPPRKPRRRKKA
jgi:hypothetical protein